ncbi:hypothetical protein [Salinimicrobium soli]|uniref:hypothetical protein n=1 Tax=Salinimicrobium soli TaxID=1254399 RepID=UPI003AAD11D8
MKTSKLKYLIILLLCSTVAVAQTRKLDKTYKTNKDVTVNIDSKHTNVVVEYWDKNEVRVEALLETSGTDKKATEKALAGWNLSTSATASEVKINSSGGMSLDNLDFAGLEGPLSQLPEMLMPLQDMMAPILESIANNPIPPEAFANMGDMHFDYEAYRKEGDKYLKKWEAKIEKNFGKDFEKSMEEWAAKFEKDSALWKKHALVMEDFGEKFGKDMEKWGEQFGKDMEKWGEQFGKDMEKWAADFEKQVEEKYGDSKGKVIVIDSDEMKAKKTLKITMPKNGNLKLNVRYGEVKLSGTTNNLQGQLSHSKFYANSVTGDKTDLKVAYTPVKVNTWNYGKLNASYVQEFTIDKVVSIKLTSNSSDVKVKHLADNGIFRGTFGELTINEVAPAFNSIDIVLENSDLKLDLPEVAYNFHYSGNKSEVKLPQGISVKSSKSYDNQKLDGYNKNKNANASVSISASFSDVLLK